MPLLESTHGSSDARAESDAKIQHVVLVPRTACCSWRWSSFVTGKDHRQQGGKRRARNIEFAFSVQVRYVCIDPMNLHISVHALYTQLTNTICAPVQDGTGAIPLKMCADRSFSDCMANSLTVEVSLPARKDDPMPVECPTRWFRTARKMRVDCTPAWKRWHDMRLSRSDISQLTVTVKRKEPADTGIQQISPPTPLTFSLPIVWTDQTAGNMPDLLCFRVWRGFSGQIVNSD